VPRCIERLEIVEQKSPLSAWKGPTNTVVMVER